MHWDRPHTQPNIARARTMAVTSSQGTHYASHTPEPTLSINKHQQAPASIIAHLALPAPKRVARVGQLVVAGVAGAQLDGRGLPRGGRELRAPALAGVVRPGARVQAGRTGHRQVHAPSRAPIVLLAELPARASDRPI